MSHFKPQYSSMSSLKMGSDAEHRFDKIAKTEKYYSSPVSQGDQKIHIDRIIDDGRKRYSVEIKSMKKVSRSDPYTQDRWIWIELHGVHEFDKGWLYGGKADLIAFEMKYGFLFVKRTDLINLVNKLVNKNVIVDSPYDAINKVYLRRKSSDFFGGGFDKVTLIDSHKIETISFMSWIV